jgi:HSP20 family protein
MTSLRYRPVYDFRNELDQMRSQLYEIFESGRPARRQMDSAVHPLLNVWEDAECFWAEAELPGLALDDLEICMTDRNTITIKGTRKEPAIDGGRWHRRERAYGCFERSLTLPGAVDEGQVEASFKHGVLTIKLPKAPELRPRKIEVKPS